MEFDRLEFVDAVEELSSQLGLDVPREDDGFPSQAIPKQEKRNFYEQMTNIAQFYETQLKKPSGKIAIDYLKNRGLSGEIVKKFGIGYIPDEWDLVRKQFGQDNESQTSLVTTGMLIENDQGRRYDRFSGRVMFPIHDRRGRVIGFGGRVLGDGTPNDLNSPETPIFHIGKELYALYQVLQAHRTRTYFGCRRVHGCCSTGSIRCRLCGRLFRYSDHWRSYALFIPPDLNRRVLLRW